MSDIRQSITNAIIEGRPGMIIGKADLAALASMFDELDTLRGIDTAGVDKILERWDNTSPAIQRGVVAALAARLVKAEDRKS